MISAFYALSVAPAPLPMRQAIPHVRPPQLSSVTAPELLPLPPGSQWFIPRPPKFPHGNSARITEDAQEISRGLNDYIVAWSAGKVPAVLPNAFVPPGVNRADFRTFMLKRPTETSPEEQWAIRPARPVDLSAAYGSFPDPNCTYLVVPAFFAPFGSKLVIEGEFPHARFMSIQVTPSFSPTTYHYDGGVGVGEVPIVDADIEPLPGHTNPFRVGADRSAEKRSYRVEYDLQIGDAVRLNESFRPPHFRQAGNRRFGGAILFQGPWGHGSSNGHRRGQWTVGQVWIRYYLPDAAKGAMAGVRLPRIWCETPDGQKFWVLSQKDTFLRRVNKAVKVRDDGFLKPNPAKLHGPQNGWYKQSGIFRSVVTGIALGTGWAGPEYVRQLDRGVAGRDENLPAPSNYEQSATSCTYIDYLVRGMSIERGQVVVLTGKLPTFPQTVRGETVMEAAQMRYWSLTGYAVPSGFDFLSALNPDNPSGIALQSLRDDELTLDEDRHYVIAFSKGRDRPKNANTSNGVTWREWGPSAEISWTLRWLSVGPEWTFERTPNPSLLGWRSEWTSPRFDPSATATNGWSGLLGPYQPRVHYLSRAQFEALGSKVRAVDVPIWR